MVNPTTIYSSLQNIPFTVITGNYQAIGSQVLATLSAGLYEVKIAGTKTTAGQAERNITINGLVILEFSQPQHQETTLFFENTGPITITGNNPTGTANAFISYQISYRKTPSLELISLAELNQMNQELEHMQEIIKNNEILTDPQLDEIKQLHEKHTSIEQKHASKGVKNA